MEAGIGEALHLVGTGNGVDVDLGRRFPWYAVQTRSRHEKPMQESVAVGIKASDVAPV